MHRIKFFQNIFMHKVNQNFINCKDKQNKDIIYEKQYISKKPSTIQWLAHITISCHRKNTENRKWMRLRQLRL